jgi:hypothetical protein
MTLARFQDDPWKTSHPFYQDSSLAMAPAPEYASSEVILSSLYRVIGLERPERLVPQGGRDLDREIQKQRDRRKQADNAALDADSFHMMLHSALESPKLPNQSSKRFLQVTPLVPQTAVFSGSARLAGSPWTPGALVRRMVWLGAESTDQAKRVWSALFKALSVDAGDDIFARFLQKEISAWVPDPQWKERESDERSILDPDDRHALSYPARQFVADLDAILDAKASVTRRQWTSLLEAIIRLAAVSHILWICEVHARTWACIREALAGAGPTTIEQARTALFPAGATYLSYGDRALPIIRDRASSFLRARLGINTVLWGLDAGAVGLEGGLASSKSLLDLCETIRASRGMLSEVPGIFDKLHEQESRVLLCSKGIGSNIMEFARHALGQRQTANAILRGYDQGYSLRKKGANKSSPWVVGLGPVAVLALVHCSLAKTTGTRSVRRLAQHLAAYGIMVDHRDIAQNDLGHQLRMLGLVLDSPDAESGMLLVRPFVEKTA